MTGVLVNGLPSEHISVADRGLLYGDGLFETLAIDAGRPLLWEAHLQRLLDGCRRLAIPAPDTHVLADEAARLCAGQARAVLKIVVTRGPAARGYAPPAVVTPTRILSRAPWPDYPAAPARHGVAVAWCATPLARNPRLAGIKHLNRLEQVLARAECRPPYVEGLMCDTDGHAIAGTMSNLFVVSGDTLATPDLSQSGVTGVVRTQVLAVARARGLDCRERRLTPAEVEAADELFLTNSIIGLWPVNRLGARTYPIGNVTQTIQQTLAAARAVALAL
ncbi:MAG: aminodeoxychorismate lyase [Gammaproteobacteria bacterium]|nr:aminodeoxychorismate lyase [Gammaproteobacteria bacterium]